MVDNGLINEILFVLKEVFFGFFEFLNRDVNRRVVVVFVVVVLVLFLLIRFDFGIFLKDLIVLVLFYEEVGFFVLLVLVLLNFI